MGAYSSQNAGHYSGTTLLISLERNIVDIADSNTVVNDIRNLKEKKKSSLHREKRLRVLLEKTKRNFEISKLL